ncbi:hypothetical protein PM082_004700 [Marasmius tenuissimus]|nr:hypothetical protein PM082_004700 [Marasmius tenuissimus]
MTTAEFRESIRITKEEELVLGILEDKVPTDYLAPINLPLHPYLKRPSTSIPRSPSTVRTRKSGKKARPSEGEETPDQRLMLGIWDDMRRGWKSTENGDVVLRRCQQKGAYHIHMPGHATMPMSQIPIGGSSCFRPFCNPHEHTETTLEYKIWGAAVIWQMEGLMKVVKLLAIRKSPPGAQTFTPRYSCCLKEILVFGWKEPGRTSRSNTSNGGPDSFVGQTKYAKRREHRENGLFTAGELIGFISFL